MRAWIFDLFGVDGFVFTKFDLPTAPATPRLIFATNKTQIFERLDSGSSMALTFRELSALVSDSKTDFPKLVYSTFRRFVAREKAKTTVQKPASDLTVNAASLSPAPIAKAASSPAPVPAKKQPQNPTGFPLREVADTTESGSLSPGDF